MPNFVYGPPPLPVVHCAICGAHLIGNGAIGKPMGFCPDNGGICEQTEVSRKPQDEVLESETYLLERKNRGNSP